MGEWGNSGLWRDRSRLLTKGSEQGGWICSCHGSVLLDSSTCFQVCTFRGMIFYKITNCRFSSIMSSRGFSGSQSNVSCAFPDLSSGNGFLDVREGGGIRPCDEGSRRKEECRALKRPFVFFACFN